MSYNNLISAISIAFFLNSCEIIRIGGRNEDFIPEKVIITDKKISLGAINAFKAEADNDNYFAMLDFISNKEEKLLAIDKLELSDEIQRLCRILKKQEVTNNTLDSLNSVQHNITLQLNYNKNIRYYLTKLDSNWYIYDYEQLSNVGELNIKNLNN